MASEIVQYQADNGQDIKVTEQDVRDLMAASGSNPQNLTPSEIKAYLRLCQAYRLNPFTKDVYIIKYGNSPAQIVAGKETFTKRASRNPRFRGYTAGITIIGSDGNLHRRKGSMLMKGENLIGGWCSVSIEGYEEPMYDEVSFEEYNAPDKYGKNGWSRMPATMIRKVAICHSLREAFPEDLGGLYGSEEMDQSRNGSGPAETPQAANPRPSGGVVECEVIETPPLPENPYKELWVEVGELKAEALARGVNETVITDWMRDNIVNPDGSPKAPNTYDGTDITKLRDHLSMKLAQMDAAMEDERAERAAKRQAIDAEQAQRQSEHAGDAESIEVEQSSIDLSDEDIPF